MFVLRNNPTGVKYLVERFGGESLQISDDYWAWVPPAGTTLCLDKVETNSTRRVERWKFNNELLVVERLETYYDEVYRPIGG